ncbi:MAG: undecaprenyl-diphosphate phosphatase [Pseudomonadota bacterium]
MSWLEIVVLAIVQGMTEFLPVSSSGHLILAPALLGWSDQGLAFDVAVHVGTLAAVVLYFRDDLTRMTVAFFGQFSTAQSDAARVDARLAGYLIAATIPAGIVGIVFRDAIEMYLRSPVIIAATTAGFGVLLYLADRFGAQRRTVEQMTWRDAVLVGIAQAAALVPGTSRSGVTMTMGMMLGLSAKAAARFSFLLSIPVIVLAGGLEALKLVKDEAAVDWSALLLGSVLSAVVAYLTIKFFLKFIANIGMLPFMLYRFGLAVVILLALS